MSKRLPETKHLVVPNSTGCGKYVFGTVLAGAAVGVIVKSVYELKKKSKDTDFENEEDIVKCTSACKEKNIKIDNKVFKGAVLRNTCSGIRLDLSNSIIKEDVKIYLKNLMSGVSILVPKHVNIDISGKTFMGGVNNIVPKAETNDPIIHIYANNVMSGLEIKLASDEDSDSQNEDVECAE